MQSWRQINTVDLNSAKIKNYANENFHQTIGERW